ncbi:MULTISPECIES: hypothetical protein [Staphylococcus]|uniref:Staphylococcal protein n=1 Tax=Staphylococcus equorum TaxID=246432 RepID=A0A1B1G7U0_9STAP|nr:MULTISPECIES: hypothetical protein [Staphylococcus]ALM57459.1 hypothetical protein SE1039_16760 [Staphylococcus equorum]ANK36892.1 hypothetical protein AOB58_90 [Staphylococcus sp. AntiMn-1]ANQ64665.1 hypothetical protein AVJ22_08375 [Staphylococcus equorum]ANR68506.1 hypothetical protein AWC34_08095 [Staphylococcus equorum]EJX18187.1 hypothetical protein SOJ_12340 [Staphylococcus sp. OJ82]
MNYITSYLEKMTKHTFRTSIVEYQRFLDKKLRSVEMYIKYLIERKGNVGSLIDRLTLSLENKYIDMLDKEYIDCAEEIEHKDIEQIKCELNEMEADYARIEADLSQQATERANIETECDLIERISLVA